MYLIFILTITKLSSTGTFSYRDLFIFYYAYQKRKIYLVQTKNFPLKLSNTLKPPTNPGSYSPLHTPQYLQGMQNAEKKRSENKYQKQTAATTKNVKCTSTKYFTKSKSNNAASYKWSESLNKMQRHMADSPHPFSTPPFGTKKGKENTKKAHTNVARSGRQLCHLG